MQPTRITQQANDLSLTEDLKTRNLILENPEGKTKIIARMIDSTLLKPDCNQSEITALCYEAIEYNFKSVCIPPSYVKLAKEILQNTPVAVCTVISFPFGYCTSKIKCKEIEIAIENGATEIDFVQNIGLIKNHQIAEFARELKEIRNIANNILLKIICETSLLTESELFKCCEIACESNIDILKTSTGYGKRGASLSDIAIMKKVTENYFKEKNRVVGIKASGGIKTAEDALAFIKAGATRLGTSSGKNLILNSTKESSLVY